jgi:ferredoxin
MAPLTRKPRIAICCYSGSGNTRLACEYIAAGMARADTTLYDIARGQTPDWEACDLVGFAAFTDFWGAPWLVHEYLGRVPVQQGKPAFVFTTFGFTPGRALRMLADWATERGFRVVAGSGLHTPENYPPMIARGRGAAGAPSVGELRGFQSFIASLASLAERLGRGEEVAEMRPRVGLASRLIRFLRTKARDDMGEKFVDTELCNECGVCAKQCPYGAIALVPKPAFDMAKCYGCWGCYNHCPTKAIYTRKFRGVGHYARPNDLLRAKLRH